jgi:hypothetical protein
MKRSRAFPVFALIMQPSRDLQIFSLIVIVCAVFDAVRRPASFDECYALTLVFQMFAASTSFRDRATRGHFDPILVCQSRCSIAGAHLAVSAAPGTVLWTVVTVMDAAVVRHFPPTGVQPAGLVAFATVSLVSWSLNLALPRYVGGVAWLMTIVVFAGSGYANVVRRALVAQPAWDRALESAAGCLVAPMLLFADRVSPGALALGVVSGAAVAAALCGMQYVVRFDAQLKDLS